MAKQIIRPGQTAQDRPKETTPAEALLEFNKALAAMNALSPPEAGERLRRAFDALIVFYPAITGWKEVLRALNRKGDELSNIQECAFILPLRHKLMTLEGQEALKLPGKDVKAAWDRATAAFNDIGNDEIKYETRLGELQARNLLEDAGRAVQALIPDLSGGTEEMRKDLRNAVNDLAHRRPDLRGWLADTIAPIHDAISSQSSETGVSPKIPPRSVRRHRPGCPRR